MYVPPIFYTGCRCMETVIPWPWRYCWTTGPMVRQKLKLTSAKSEFGIFAWVSGQKSLQEKWLSVSVFECPRKPVISHPDYIYFSLTMDFFFFVFFFWNPELILKWFDNYWITFSGEHYSSPVCRATEMWRRLPQRDLLSAFSQWTR